MRDLLILSIVALACLAALKRPWIGMLLWTVISLGYPHEQFGYETATMPLAAAAAIATLIGLLFTKERLNPWARPASVAILMFFAWTTITLPFSYYFDASLSLWERSMKIFLMVFVTIALIDSPRKLQWFIWVCVMSVAFYGVKGGVFTIVTGGGYRVWGPGGFIGGNNEIAAALVKVIPLVYYLMMQSHNRWVRRALLATMVLSAVAVLGTHSRGALLAVGAMGAFLWLKAPRKLVGGVLMAVAGVTMLTFMPEHWWARMETIQDYREDDSALGRLNAWQFAWRMASDNFFGGGFMIYEPDLFLKYAPDPDRIHAAHSIYFQVLGEHGFVGLALFLAVGVFTWLDARRLIKTSRLDPSLKWASDLGRMVQVSMVGFAVGGAFLSLAYYDLPYNVTVMVVCAVHLVSRRTAETHQAKVAARAADGDTGDERNPTRPALGA